MTELLSPAGNAEALDAAFGEGADAVYMGLKNFNARLRSSNFSWREFEASVYSAHRMGKKIYVTVNTVSEECETEKLYRFLSYLNDVGPDALIVQDFGVVRMCQEFFPSLKLHASTQMNVESAAAANLLLGEGFERVVLARELGLEEIKKIKQSTKAQLEIFVHGALCVSESGLCLFSSFLGGKSANRGVCTQACRRFYSAELPGGTKQGYYFSPCDLQLIDYVPSLMEIGVESFKIEGRMKSAEYVGAVTAAYRYVMDHWQEDRKGAIAEGKRILSTDFARSKTDYWYGFKAAEEGIPLAGQKILNPNQAGGTGIYLGDVSELRPANQAELEKYANLAKTSPSLKLDESFQMALLRGGSYDTDPGDSIRLHRKDDTGRQSHKVRIITQNENGTRWIDIPMGFSHGDSVYLLQTKSMSKRYKRVLPQDLAPFKKVPGGERLPVLDLTPVKKNELKWFPEGLYIAVSTVSDAHTVQTAHPVRLLLELNSETEYDLLKKDSSEKPLLPMSRKSVFILLDPYVPEGSYEHLSQVLAALVEKGWCNFVVNNLAHIEMLKGKKVNLLGGPYLYTFNKWAVSFLENQNIMAFIPPVEDSSDNLEQTFKTPEERGRALLTVFSYPVLFRMRFKLPEDYDFTYFTDKEGLSFKVNSTKDGSFVMPELPFSIIDRMDKIKSKGWTHLLLDFTKTKVLKGDMRIMTELLRKGEGIPGSSRFNWKDGFFNPEKMEAYQAIAQKEAARAASESFAKGAKSSRNSGARTSYTKNIASRGKTNSSAKGKGRRK